MAHQIIGQLYSQASQMAYSGWLSPFLLQSSFHLKLLSFYNGFHHQASLWYRFIHLTGKVENAAVLPKAPLVLPCLFSAFNGTS